MKKLAVAAAKTMTALITLILITAWALFPPTLAYAYEGYADETNAASSAESSAPAANDASTVATQGVNSATQVGAASAAGASAGGSASAGASAGASGAPTPTEGAAAAAGETAATVQAAPTAPTNGAPANAAPATPVTVSVTSTGGESTDDLLDGSYDTSVTLAANESLTVSAADGSAFGNLYVRFYTIPGSWMVRYTDVSGASHVQPCGQNGYLHEFVVLEGAATNAELVFPSGAAICTLDAYTQGSAPAGVQAWNPPCTMADFMVCSTHADDEILWLGGVLATYAGGRGLSTQVVYMNNYWDGDIKREHEKLDGLWTIGVRNYPINAPLGDTYADSLETAQTIYDQAEVTAFFTEQMRRFKPQVVVSQAFNGEYGHGAHQLLALAVRDAVDKSADASFNSASAQAYGVWDVPKAYFHLYDENPITLDLRQPIANLGGLTSIEAQQEAYKKHVTQQWTYFYVTDDPTDPNGDAFNCSAFGLYRSLVGPDTTNDMFEHLTSYEQQAAQKAAEEEAQRQAQEAQARAAEKAAAEAAEAEKAAEEEKGHALPVLIIAVVAGLLLLAIAVAAIILSRR
ncbi:MAG: PIG-L family deacetylase [Atopobiaceae bacterium]|nr:PIG-L family deacetylase [Atopobiaceae bacterium]